jgi:PIN domain nuclease of toxin-antitoxin system
MRLLLDTHAFLWWNEGNPKLSRRVQSVLSDSRNSLFLSVASAWEIAFKTQTGKLGLPEPVASYVTGRLQHYRIDALSINLSHVLAAEALPPLHRDPFDRILIAQGQVEQLALVTHDAQIQQYDIETIW